jgi:hypothetical protein
MSGAMIIRSSLSSPTLVVSSGGGRSGNLMIRTSAEAIFATANGAGAVLTSNRSGAVRQVKSGSRRATWIGARPTPAIERLERRPAESREAPAGAAAAAEKAPPQTAEPPAAAKTASEPAPAEETARPAAEAAEATETAAPPPAEPRAASKLELAIDSLPGYELNTPIPVIVEPLGNKVFVAEVPDLDISITGSSVSGVLLQLKDQIVRVYEGHRTKRNPDPERSRQLAKLETYIVKRRNWF